MSLGHIGKISLEHIDPNALGGVSYIEMWYSVAHPVNHINYSSHRADPDVYIRWGLNNKRAKIFVEDL